MTNRDLCECGHRTHTRQCAAYLPEENGPKKLVNSLD